jgi:phosphatidylserine/phosphatidylglycerophosphate/cardiolipin synthase-like enzyme
MKLLIQPDDGVRPLVTAITGARESIEIAIFRLEQREIERALANAIGRGVAVHALVAHTNRTGEEGLRQLEMRLLAAGVTVTRTADDLARYHGKLMIVDRHELYLLAFNPTYSDIEHCRSFGVVTGRPELVREAERLFEADAKRQPYEPKSDSLVVSPVNARPMLSAFISGAKKELLIYDPKVSDLAMVRLLEGRAAAGVRIRIIGHLTRNISGAAVRRLPQMRVHTRTMVRDGRIAFIGSQSLRAVELDARREVGLILRAPKVVARLHRIFAHDWALAGKAAESIERHQPATRVAKKVAKLLAKELPPVAPVLNGAVKEIVGKTADVELDPEEVEAALRGAVKTAVKEVVNDIVEEAVDEDAARTLNDRGT